MGCGLFVVIVISALVFCGWWSVVQSWALMVSGVVLSWVVGWRRAWGVCGWFIGGRWKRQVNTASCKYRASTETGIVCCPSCCADCSAASDHPNVVCDECQY